MKAVGINDICVEVTNTLVKSVHNNVFDRYFVQDPTGLTESVKLYRRNR